MKYEYLTNEDLDIAVNEYIAALKSEGLNVKTEVIPVFEAAGRITANAVYAHICAPHYNAAAMDGIALMANVTFGATETTPVKSTFINKSAISKKMILFEVSVISSS